MKLSVLVACVNFLSSVTQKVRPAPPFEGHINWIDTSTANTRMSEADLELMTLVAKGNSNAQRTVVERLFTRAERLAMSLLHERADASDATQASLIEILRCAGSYRGESGLERWADRIVIRTAMRLAIERRRPPPGAADPVPTPQNGSRAEAPILVEQYLRGLPEPQRIAVLLRHMYDCSVEEIAELTEVSPNTVKDRLLRGRDQIRRVVHRETLKLASSGRGGSR